MWHFAADPSIRIISRCRLSAMFSGLSKHQCEDDKRDGAVFHPPSLLSGFFWFRPYTELAVISDTLYEHPKSRVEKSTPCLMCVCAQPYPLFHLHVWCYRVAAGRRGGWTGKPCCSSAPHRLLASNPLSCSGKSADSALFHPLSPNPAGCGSGGIILD